MIPNLTRSARRRLARTRRRAVRAEAAPVRTAAQHRRRFEPIPQEASEYLDGPPREGALNIGGNGRPLNVSIGRTPVAAAQKASGDPYEGWSGDHRLRRLVAAAGYRTADLPTTARGLLSALEALDVLDGDVQCLDGVVQGVGKREDLNLQLAHSIAGVLSLDLGNGDEAAGRAVEDPLDVGPDVLRSVEPAHETSPSLDGRSSPSVGDGLVGGDPCAPPTGRERACQRAGEQLDRAVAARDALPLEEAAAAAYTPGSGPSLAEITIRIHAARNPGNP